VLTDRLSAPRFKLVFAETTCHACQRATPTCAVWVPGVEVTGEDPEDWSAHGPALLHAIEWLSPSVEAQVSAQAPWLRMWNETPAPYLAHHCVHCGAVQGDWFVFGYGKGPYWPENFEEFSRFRVMDGEGPLEANADPAWATWMEWVESPPSRQP